MNESKSQYFGPDQSLVLLSPQIIQFGKNKTVNNIQKNNGDKSKGNSLKATKKLKILQFYGSFLIVVRGNNVEIFKYSLANEHYLREEQNFVVNSRINPKKQKTNALSSELINTFREEKVIQNKIPVEKMTDDFKANQGLDPLCRVICDMKEIKNFRIFQNNSDISKSSKNFFKQNPEKVYIVAEDSHSPKFQFLIFDIQKLHVCKKIESITLTSAILCWSFIYHNEILVWCQDMNLYHYALDAIEGFKCVRVFSSKIDPAKQFYELRKLQNPHQTSKSAKKSNQKAKVDTGRQNSLNKMISSTISPFINYILPQKTAPKKIKVQSEETLQYKMNSSAILGCKQLQKQQLIILFFTLYNESYNILKIKCIEIIYPLENIEPVKSYTTMIRPLLGLSQYKKYPQIFVLDKVYEIVSYNTACPEIIDEVNMSKVGCSYYLRLKSEVIFIQKKFEQYYAVDSIKNLKKTNSFVFSDNNNLVTSQNVDKSITELHQIKGLRNSESEQTSKVNLQIIDFIDLREEYLKIKEKRKQRLFKKELDIKNQFGWYLQEPYSDGDRQCCFINLILSQTQQMQQFKQQNKRKIHKKLLKFWIKKIDSNYYFWFLFQVSSNAMIDNNEEPCLCLYMGRKVSKIKKIIDIAKSYKTQQQIVNIQALGEMLGISKNNFYYNLWKQSKQSFNDINRYLLKCSQYDKIITQLKYYLKRRPTKAVKLTKIIKQIVQITKRNLVQGINSENLRHYFGIEFILRKFMVYSSQFEIDDVEFTETVEKSLYDFIEQVVNQTLHPQQIKCSVWDGKKKQSPKLELLMILNMFKLPLLEDYPQFLELFLKNHKNELVTLLSSFPELLPKYPYFTEDQYQILKSSTFIFKSNRSRQQVVEALLDFKPYANCEINQDEVQQQRQQGIFSKIMPEHFVRESAFIHNLSIYLDSDFSSILLMKMIEDLLNDTLEGLKLKQEKPLVKFTNHMIILSDVQTYIQKVKSMSGIALYIFVLQYLIKNAIHTKKQAEISDLICLYIKNYDLPRQIAHKLEIRAGLYKIILQNTILGEDKVSLQKIYEEPIEKWIALFFLGNKDQKQLLCTEFMNLFQNPSEYLEATSCYIKSELCSKIQLSILTEVIAQKTEQQQLEYQDLIEVIIQGFCTKIQIRDIADCNNFLHHINNLHFKPELLFKIDQIEKFKICLRIFEVFFMENKTLQQLLDNAIGIINEMMEAFFNGNLRRQQVPIKKGFLLIEDCLGLWDLICYLKNIVFFGYTTSDFLIVYCKKLIEWQRFDEVNQLLFESDRLYCPDGQRQIKPTIMSQKLISQSLSDLYLNQKLLFDDKVKKYINDILSIEKYPSLNKRVIKEKARLKLAQRMESWGYRIGLLDLQVMCNQWQSCQEEANEEDRLGGMYYRPIMMEIIEKYGKHLNKQTLGELYGQFVTATQGIEDPFIKTHQFYNYCTKLCEILVDLSHYKEASQIICVLNQKFEMNYLLMTECMLKLLLLQFQQKHSNQQCNQFYNICDCQSQVGQMQLKNQIIQNKVQQQLVPFQKLHSTPVVRHNIVIKKSYYKRTHTSPSIPLKNNWKFVTTTSILNNPKQLPVQFSLSHKSSQSNQSSNVFSQNMEFIDYGMQKKIKACKIMKNYIDYFVINWINKRQDRLSKLFKNLFQDQVVSNVPNDQSQSSFSDSARITEQKPKQGVVQITINNEISFKNHRYKISTDKIWDLVVLGLAEKPSTNRQQILKNAHRSTNFKLFQDINVQQLVYCYFFMIMGLSQPKIGFELIQYIGYNHAKIVKIFSIFEHCCDTIKQLNCIDYSIIFKLYLNSLTKLMILKYESDGSHQCQLYNNPYMTNEKFLDQQHSSHQQQSDKIPQNFELHKKIAIQNLVLFRQSLKEGHYKEDELHPVILRMIDIESIARKNSSNRLKKYNSLLQSKKSNVNNNISRMTERQQINSLRNTFGKSKNQTFFQVIDQVPIKPSEISSLKVLKFEDYRKMKKKLLKEQNQTQSHISCRDHEELTQRSIVHEILRHINPTNINIPKQHNQSIREAVNQSFRQIQENKINFSSDQKYLEESSLSPIIPFNLNTTMPLHSQKKCRFNDGPRKLLEILKVKDYTGLDYWSPDAILLQTVHIYMKDEVQFINVIEMFHQLLVGSHNKIQVLYTCLTQNQEGFKISNIILKRIFTLQYLNKDFPSQFSNYSWQIKSNISSCALRILPEQINQLSTFITKISETQFRKKGKSDWNFIISQIVLQKIAKRAQYDDFAVKKIIQIVNFFRQFKQPGRQYIKNNYGQIIYHYEKSKNQNLIKCVKDSLKNYLKFDIEQLEHLRSIKEKEREQKNQQILDCSGVQSGISSEIFQETDSLQYNQN